MASSRVFLALLTFFTSFILAGLGINIGDKLTGVGLPDHTLVQIKWTGEISPGVGNQTLFGDDIYDIVSKIKAINPSYGSNTTGSVANEDTLLSACASCNKTQILYADGSAAPTTVRSISVRTMYVCLLGATVL